jgi:hypothetical protein
MASEALALTTVELMTTASALEAAKTELERRRAG